MKLNWGVEKNLELITERGISFTDIFQAIEDGELIADIDHPKEEYSHQRMLVVRVKDYVYLVPYVFQEDGTRFLKTIYPSRAATKKYKP